MEIDRRVRPQFCTLYRGEKQNIFDYVNPFFLRNCHKFHDVVAFFDSFNNSLEMRKLVGYIEKGVKKRE